MKGLVQRVVKASVTVGDEAISSIGKGICVLVGISRGDNRADLEWLARKVVNLRVFEDDAGKGWSKSVKDRNLEILCVSQFTLYGVMKGNKPDFHDAMGPETSQDFYNDFLAELRKLYKPDMVKDGRFGAYMQVHIQNDGPVTIDLESPQGLPQPKQRKPVNPPKAKQGAAAAGGEGAQEVTPTAVVAPMPQGAQAGSEGASGTDDLARELQDKLSS